MAFIISITLLTTPLMAANTDEPVSIVKTKLDEVTVILENKDMPLEQKRAAIIDAVSPVFDLQLMAKLVLGKENWGRFSTEERKEFSDVFIDRLKRLYLSKLEMYSGEKVIFQKPTDNGDKVSVPTAVISEGETLPVVYKLYRSPKGWLAYDVDISGTSVIASHRNEYNAFLKEGTPQQLIDKLKQTD
jgi:phospholipid transport system substrate-binding protein